MVLRHDFEQWQAAALMVTEMSLLKHEPFYSVGDERSICSSVCYSG